MILQVSTIDDTVQLLSQKVENHQIGEISEQQRNDLKKRKIIVEV